MFNLLVKLLKRLLDFKPLLLFLIKCTEKKAAEMKDRPRPPARQQTAPPRRSGRPGHPLRHRRRAPAPPHAGPSHQPLRARRRQVGGPTPPPSFNMHPASMLNLDL